MQRCLGAIRPFHKRETKQISEQADIIDAENKYLQQHSLVLLGVHAAIDAMPPHLAYKSPKDSIFNMGADPGCGDFNCHSFFLVLESLSRPWTAWVLNFKMHQRSILGAIARLRCVVWGIGDDFVWLTVALGGFGACYICIGLFDLALSWRTSTPIFLGFIYVLLTSIWDYIDRYK